MVKIIRVAVVLFLVLLLSVPNVFAAWVYFTNPPAPATTNLQTKIFEFKEYRGVYIKSIERISHSNLQLTKTDISIPAVITNEVKITSSGASVTYKVTVHNNTDVYYWFVDAAATGNYGNNALVGTNGGVNLVLKDHSSDAGATFNADDWIPPMTEREFYVTYNYGSNATGTVATSIDFRFSVKMDSVHDEFLSVLNNSAPGTGYYTLTELFDALYQKDGTTAISSTSHPEIIESLFGDLMVNIDGEEKQADIVLRRENLDNDDGSGDDYSGSGPQGCEYAIYITVDGLTPGSTATVYAIAYSSGASGMGDSWYQVGELYEGTAPVKGDGTIDYANWKASHKTYEIADGLSYVVGAPNGDQYDIMNTLEDLISAVDQDIFNQIDNTNIFKKVYDVIAKHPNSTDPAVEGLRKAFADASLFYKNLNNGQEFKVVRDKYTRAEIIHAISNIQKALDYYYQIYG